MILDIIKLYLSLLIVKKLDKKLTYYKSEFYLKDHWGSDWAVKFYSISRLYSHLRKEEKNETR